MLIPSDNRHWFWLMARQARISLDGATALLMHVSGYSDEEIAGHMEKSEIAVKKLRMRAQQRLRDNEPYMMLSHDGETWENLRARLRREASELLECVANRLPSGKPPFPVQYDDAGNVVGRPARAVTIEDIVERKEVLFFGARRIVSGQPDPEKNAAGVG